MTSGGREKWDAKVDFAAKRLADFEGKDWDKLPSTSRWFACKARYRHLASAAIGAANLWDMFSDYRSIRKGEA